MQISSATLPIFGNQHLNPHVAARPADGEVSPAGSAVAAGTVAPVSASQKSAETANSQTSPKKQNLPSDTDATNTKQEKEKDPLSDPSSAEYAQVKELAARDREVRAHEQAHLSVAGRYATSGAKYSYQTGPDGQKYAIGGEVGIDVSSIPGDPEATIAKMQVVQAAAVAPAEPSSQDLRVAAQAGQTAAAARAELAAQRFSEAQGDGASNPESGEQKQANATQTQTQTHNEREASKSYSAQLDDETTSSNFSTSV